MIAGQRPIWMERQGLVAIGLKALILTVVVLLVVLPFLSVVSTSLATQKEIAESGGLVLIPLHPSLDAYRTILAGGVVSRAVLVSTGVTFFGTALSMLATVTLAYALSRPGVVASKPVLLIVLLTFLFTPGIIPSYLMVKQLGLLNHYASLVLPILINTFNLVVLRAFFMNIPQELTDSARIDGAGDLSILIRIVLPLSKAVLAVTALFYAVAYWNAFFQALLYLNDTAMWPLQLVLRLYVLEGAPLPDAGMTEQGAPPVQSIQMAVVTIATVPILLVYPFLQRYFGQGVLTGAVKG